MSELEKVLLKPIVENTRTRAYQEAIDRSIDELKMRYDPDRGLIGTRELSLAHEQMPGFWDLPATERLRLGPPEVEDLYLRQSGRGHTSPLCRAAFAWYSPLSKHHGDPELLRFFESGLRYTVGSIRDDGRVAAWSDGQQWSSGWDVEGLIYGICLCREELDEELLAQTAERFRPTARRLASLEPVPAVIGSFGNQRAVYALGLQLLGQWLGMPEIVEASDRFWRDAMPYILDGSGQVVEQHGPCMHYSYTAFIYAWLNLVARGDTSQLDRLLRCLRWFCSMHTRSGYPMAGVSTRAYRERMTHQPGDLWPAAEQVAHLDPSIRAFVDRALYRADHGTGAIPKGLTIEDVNVRPVSHGACGLMRAMLMTQEEAAVPEGAPKNGTKTFHFYDTLQLLKRSPFKYLLVEKDYQTMFACATYLPFSGIQTWALGDEPPIVHPTPLAPSTTQGDRLDTARQGVSHNWGLYGAGALGVDAYCREPVEEDEFLLLVTRYDWLWRVACFTERSTLMLEFGNGGPRRTFWTLNRLDPSEPEFGDRVVAFSGRRARLHTSIPSSPVLLSFDEGDPWTKDVWQIVYECGDGPVAFAFSDASFRFEGEPLEDGRRLRFADELGRYELTLDDRFFIENPGNLRVDTFQLAAGSSARRVR